MVSTKDMHKLKSCLFIYVLVVQAQQRQIEQAIIFRIRCFLDVLKTFIIRSKDVLLSRLMFIKASCYDY